jgi:hypothetical protein
VTNKSAPLSSIVIHSVARLVDDSQATREPSHSDIEFQIVQAGLAAGDPNRTPGRQPIGKMKRLRATLSWAIENNASGGEQLVAGIVDLLRSCGGFRPDSPNYVGTEPIQNAISVFRSEGYDLSGDGQLRPQILESLSGEELTSALESYVRRAKQGAADAALLVGTGKDLLEAVAAHLVRERYGQDPGTTNFPTLLEGAFLSVEMATTKIMPGEPTGKRLERALYEAGCAVNNLRNKQGTGHGRPWLPTVSDAEARSAIEIIGCIAERLLAAHRALPHRTP